jgi:hypothetical protein
MFQKFSDAHANFLKDSNVNPKVKTTEGVGVRFLVCNTSGVRGACWNSRMRIRMGDK